MSFSVDLGDYHLADADRLPVVTSDTIAGSYGSTPEGFVREQSFVTGVSSHSKVAEPDPTENKLLRVGSPPTPPGQKVAVPDGRQSKRIAVPLNTCKSGDFRRTIHMSNEKPEERMRCGVKLYAGAMNPLALQVHGRRR